MKVGNMLSLVLFFILISACSNAYPWTEVQQKIHNPKSERFRDLENILRDPEIQKIILAEKSSNALGHMSADVRSESDGCACVNYNCGCCEHMDVKEIHLNATGCVNISYLPAPDYGISATLTFNGRTIINETVSARNPPPICADVPYLKEAASVCLRFYNLAITNNSLTGCVKLEARLAHIMVENINIGCFKIPPESQEQGKQPGAERWLKYQGRQSSDTYLKDGYHSVPEKPVNVDPLNDESQRILVRLNRN